MDELLYGAAYYPEYMPEDRINRDMDLMVKAGFNLIRIAESTWSTWEPEDGRFDFSLLRRTLSAARRHGLRVIVGTPTYAIPPWLYKKHPDIMTETHAGRSRYGGRQQFDLTDPDYLFHCERIIRRLLEVTSKYDCVIGYQLDNETKPYDTCSPRVQAMFREHLREKFGTAEAMNRAYGFAYWSNAVADFDELPDVRGTINASYGAEFQAFQRSLVTRFLLWQRSIVDEYLKPGQFVTHNFDYEWRGWSYGLQPDVDHFEAAKALTVAGCDIYHQSGEHFDGAEIAFCGALARSLKKDGYLVLETFAQGNFSFLPYPGQLKLQAFAHIASGARCVEYWHWHSIHNSLESFWKGVLSHDLTPGETYRECAEIGRELARLSPRLCGLQKRNRIAVMVSNRSQTALNWFPCCRPGGRPDKNYSDILRWICDSLYRLNAEYDILWDSERDFSGYDLIVTPALYAADDSLISALTAFVERGGKLISTFRSFFADPDLKIRRDAQPHGMTRVFGLRYDRFTVPESAGVRSGKIRLPEGTAASDWLELPELHGAQVLCSLSHRAWDRSPVVTVNSFGAGKAVYIASCFDAAALDEVLDYLLRDFNIPLPGIRFPLVLKRARSPEGKDLVFFLNFSPDPHPLPYGGELPPWGVEIRENGKPI